MSTFPHTCSAVNHTYWPKSFVNSPVEVEASSIDQVVQTQTDKDSFYLWKQSLNAVELWRVSNVEDGKYVEALVFLLDRLRLVHRKVVLKECYGPLLKLRAQLSKKSYEVFLVDCLHEDRGRKHPIFGCHSCDDRPVALVHVHLVYSEVCVSGRPLFSG